MGKKGGERSCRRGGWPSSWRFYHEMEGGRRATLLSKKGDRPLRGVPGAVWRRGWWLGGVVSKPACQPHKSVAVQKCQQQKHEGDAIERQQKQLSEMALIASGPYHCAIPTLVRTTGYKSHF
eukprot:153668-Chlamydomonas_euryale.AAC.2